jgi:hypothetical protein
MVIVFWDAPLALLAVFGPIRLDCQAVLTVSLLGLVGLFSFELGIYGEAVL